MRTLFAVGMLLVGCTVSRGGDAVSVTPVEAREALGRATVFMQSLSVGGGYLWLYSLDLQRRAGESVADADHIWIQPPGTPAVGEAYLRAHAATGEQRYLDAARTVAEALGRCQLASGGWHYSANTARPEDNRDGQLDYKGRAFARANPGKPINPLYMIATTFDDDNTQSAVRFLTACVVAARGTDPRDRATRATARSARPLIARSRACSARNIPTAPGRSATTAGRTIPRSILRGPRASRSTIRARGRATRTIRRATR